MSEPIIHHTPHEGYMDELDCSSVECEWAAYYYGAYDYEGQGQILMRKKKRWYLHDMGHCSCYGPLEEIEFTHGFKTLQKLYKNITGTWLKEIMILVDCAKTHTEEWQ